MAALRRILRFALAFLPIAAWADSIRLNPPSPYVADKATLDRTEQVARRATAVANRIYGQSFSVSYGKDPADATYVADLVPVSAPGYSALTVTVKRAKDERVLGAEAIYGAFDEGMARALASLLHAQWALLDESRASPVGEAPELVEELPAEALARTVLPPGMSAYLAPFGAAVRGNGNVVVGLGAVAVEMDRWLRIVSLPGRALLEGGNFTSSYGVAVTPADTLYLKPVSGRDVYRLTDANPRPQRVRLTLETSGAFAALPDGSIVLADWQQKKALRFEGQRVTELPLFSGQWSYLSAMAAGPEETLWVCDSNLRSVRVYSTRGDLLDVIVPVIEATAAGMPMSMAVYQDGSFILHSSSGHLSRYRRDGTPVWRIAEIPGGGAIPMQAGVAVDSSSGCLYIADFAGKRLLKLLDLSYRMEHGISGGPEEGLVDLGRRQRESPDDPAPGLARAALYEQAGAFEVARSLLEGVLDAHPSLADAATGLERLEVALLKASAESSRARAVELLATLGPASARSVYDATMRLYEQILSVSPDEQGVREAMGELEQRFRERASGETRRLPLTIAALDLSNVFPALLQSYRESPVGYVTLKNTLSEDVRNLRASIVVMRYSDYPTESATVPLLKVGESLRVGLPLLLNTQVLELQEDLPVQVEVRIAYEAGGQAQEVTKTGSLTIYRRTALLWDDSGKLASFVTPNESTVARFALRAAEGATGVAGRLPARVLRGMRICDALGAYGISYVEDPDSPISRVLGRGQALDTVRFPRMTLAVKSGDCDDTTALLASLLESAGIGTAILTTPGHVFLAFDTGEPAENAWLFEAEGYAVIREGGSVWIPVETTAVRNGFFAAWSAASELVRRHGAAGSLEVIPVAQGWSSYPSLPLPEWSFSVVEPGAEDVARLWGATARSVTDVLYTTRLLELSGELSDKSGVRSVKAKNRIAALHARFGNDRDAEATLLSCVAEDPGFIASYVNLGSLYLAAGRAADARVLLERARARNPDATLVNLLLAECLFELGDATGAGVLYAGVRLAAPELADRYSYLGSSDGTARASEAGARGAAIWYDGEGQGDYP